MVQRALYLVKHKRRRLGGGSEFIKVCVPEVHFVHAREAPRHVGMLRSGAPGSHPSGGSRGVTFGNSETGATRGGGAGGGGFKGCTLEVLFPVWWC